MISTPSGEILENTVFVTKWSANVQANLLSDFVDVISAVDQVIEESAGGQLLVLALRAHAVQSDALESADQLSDGLTLWTRKKMVTNKKADKSFIKS